MRLPLHALFLVVLASFSPLVSFGAELGDNKKKGLIEQIAWSPDAKWILTAGGDHHGLIAVYDAESGGRLHQDFSNIYTASHRRVARWTIV